MTFEKYIAQIDPHEMALRIAESLMGLNRPFGKTAEQALTEMKSQDSQAVAGFYRAALAAAKYLEEAINDYQRVQ